MTKPWENIVKDSNRKPNKIPVSKGGKYFHIHMSLMTLTHYVSITKEIGFGECLNLFLLY